MCYFYTFETCKFCIDILIFAQILLKFHDMEVCDVGPYIIS
jgi:hypothetical protein